MNLLNQKGMGVLDSIIAASLLTGLIYGTARVLDNNMRVRVDASGKAALKKFESGFGPTLTQALHNYFRSLNKTYECNANQLPFQDQFAVIVLPQGEQLSLIDPNDSATITQIAWNQEASQRCISEQTWQVSSNLSAIDSFYFCMRISGGPQVSEGFVEFRFRERDIQSNRSLPCESIGEGIADLQRVELLFTVHSKPVGNIRALATSGFANLPLRSDKPSREHEANFGLVDASAKTFFLDTDGDGRLDESFKMTGLGNSTFIPVSGDWNGDEQETSGVGLYDITAKTYYLKDTLQTGAADYQYHYTQPQDGWLPVTGHWGNGPQHGLGFFDSTTVTFYLDTQRSGQFDQTFTINDARLDLQSAKPFSGDWTGTGQAGVALMDKNYKVCLKSSFVDGPCDGQIVEMGCPTGTACIAFGGNVDSTSNLDKLHLFAPTVGTFYWFDLDQNGLQFAWDTYVTMGPAPSPWLPLKGFWKGK